jgi:hypothetical protein
MNSKVKEDFDKIERARLGSRAEYKGVVYNKGYLFTLLMVVALGTVNFGYSIGAWNNA